LTRPRTAQEALEVFEALPLSDIKPGLDRMHFALDALGHPEEKFKALHVAGTNGKGSTCAFLERALRSGGTKVGLYTSPHLLKVNERFKVNGVEISDAGLGECMLELLARVPETLKLTYFELGTLAAYWIFAREKVDAAVIETGLGGRLDATATCKPIVTAVTAIGFDHMEWLGNSLDLIASEKAGIFKKGVPAVVARQPREALDAIERVARDVGAPLSIEGQDFRLEPREGRPGLTWTGRRRTLDGLELGLKGPHQLQNAAVALACLEAAEGVLPPVPAEAIARGLEEARWPCRLEAIGDDPLILLDGAHNPQGAQALRTALDSIYGTRPVHLVFGVLSDKDWKSMVRTLFPRAAHVHLCPVSGARGQAPGPIAAEGQGLAPEITVHASGRVALAAARASARREAAIVVACGSLYLMGELRQALVDEGLAK
jgi:dihydrofolate synthase / folylpolyglutamate synthase